MMTLLAAVQTGRQPLFEGSCSPVAVLAALPGPPCWTHPATCRTHTLITHNPPERSVASWFQFAFKFGSLIVHARRDG
jgi:hypothetical protein